MFILKASFHVQHEKNLKARKAEKCMKKTNADPVRTQR